MKGKDISNQKFGRLTAIRRTDEKKGNTYIWECKCDCGNIAYVPLNYMTSGKTRSCGCLSDENRHKKRINIIGNRYGRLVVLDDTREKTKQGYPIYRCICDCGNYEYTTSNNLRMGHVKSCGCYGSEIKSEVHRKHGGWKTRLYSIWLGMKDRCNNPDNPHFEYYGGRGIKVCPEWNDCFEKFRDWSIANGYAKGLSIDRINTNGIYEPNNCRWSTVKEQCRNRRSNVIISYGGESKCLVEWAEILGVKYGCLHSRYRSGLRGEECLFGKTK